MLDIYMIDLNSQFSIEIEYEYQYMIEYDLIKISNNIHIEYQY